MKLDHRRVSPSPAPRSDSGEPSWCGLEQDLEPRLRFLGRQWFEAWGQHYLPRGPLRGPVRYEVARCDSGRPLAVMPWVPLGPPPLVIAILAGLYVPFRGIPMAARSVGQAAERLASRIERRRSIACLRLSPVDSEDPAVDGLVKELAKAGWAVHRDEFGDRWVLDLSPSAEAFERSLGRNLRKTIRRGRRSLARQGEVSVVGYRDLTSDAWDSLIGRIAAIEARSWLAEDGYDTGFHDADKRRFWHELSSYPDMARRTRVWLLKVDDRDVAFSFCFDADDVRYNVYAHFDRSFARSSPGAVLDWEVYRQSIAEGIRTVCLGPAASEYKQRWGARSAGRLVDYWLFRPGLRGALLRALACARSAWRGGRSSEQQPRATR